MLFFYFFLGLILVKGLSSRGLDAAKDFLTFELNIYYATSSQAKRRKNLYLK